MLKEYLALEGIPGQKTDSEKFAGAEKTFSIEFVMPDGRISQGPDFHNDGQKFARAFDITFLDRKGNREYVYQNTFAISTRIIGIMLGMHGDNKGIIIPPKLARTQIVIIPIYKESNMDMVLKASLELKKRLSKSFRVFLDDSDAYSPGWKFNEWEKCGTPIRIELGEREISSKSVIVVRRDTNEKIEIDEVKLENELPKILESIHQNLYERSRNLIKSKLVKVENYEQLKEVIAAGKAAKALWCGNAACEEKIKDETSAKSSNMPFGEQDNVSGKCVYCGQPAKYVLNFGRSY
ncbi:MAG: His/Gly/Thr/Pro-type tRNA ligase C-terminal domain-containing protein [Candidatus Micrarchaeaceae archaeon]